VEADHSLTLAATSRSRLHRGCGLAESGVL
jgi:hypothetical protein